MKRGDVFIVPLDPALGHEQQGTRPVVVISAPDFNNATRMPIIAPVTTGGNFARLAGFSVSLSGCGTRTSGVVRCDQIRSLDLQARNARWVERLPDFVLEEISQKLAVIFDWE